MKISEIIDCENVQILRNECINLLCKIQKIDKTVDSVFSNEMTADTALKSIKDEINKES